MDRDLLELMVAYAFVDSDAIAGACPAAPAREAPAPKRTAGLAPLRLAITSAAPAAGRTTLVAGLAAAWARAGRSVLVVDLDPTDELARQLLFGSAITVNTGQLLLRAVADGGIAEPSHSVVPGVDLVAGGGLGGDPEALAAVLRDRPEGLRDALAPWLDRYDRILIDVPNAPDALRIAARTISDAGLVAVPAPALAAGPLPPSAAFLPDRRRLGAVLTRFDGASPPSPEAIAELVEHGLLDTAVPELAGVRCAWDVIAGTAGRGGDDVFAALARELDTLRAGRPRPLRIGNAPETPLRAPKPTVRA